MASYFAEVASQKGIRNLLAISRCHWLATEAGEAMRMRLAKPER